MLFNVICLEVLLGQYSESAAPIIDSVCLYIALFVFETGLSRAADFIFLSKCTLEMISLTDL